MRLTARVYLFALACLVVATVSQIVLIAFVARPLLHGREIAVVRGYVALLERVPDRAAAVAAVAEVERATGGDVEVLARGDARLDPAAWRALARDAIVQPDPETDVLAIRAGALAGDALRVRFPPPPILRGELAVILGVLMVLLLGLSVAFARALARPLGRLATVATRLGAGDLRARSGLVRADELGQVGRAFDEMADRLDGLLAAQRTLLANVSHELRTPMARIRVAVELAGEDPVAAQELLAGVGADLTELERLVDDVLTMTRLETRAAPPPRREPVAPDELAARAERGFAQRHPGRALVVHVEAGLPALEVDPVLVRRVIDNLLDNAVKHGPAGAPVRLRVSADGGAVGFAIEDDGAGLTAEERDAAFTPFWRSDASRNRETGGVGLGLALAREIARAHGGDVTLAAGATGGLIATVRLPAAETR